MSSDSSLNVKRIDSCSDDNLTVIEVTTGSCAGVHKSTSNGSSVTPVPDNMLYNIGLDSAATDLVCLSPSNAIFHPSDAAIYESQLKGKGGTKRRGDELPIALVVPLYYALQTRTEGSVGVSDMNSTGDPGRTGSGDIGGVRASGGGSTLLSQYDATNINASSSFEALSSVRYFPYPSRNNHRTSQQSKRLLKPFRPTSSQPHTTQDLLEVPFNAQVLQLYTLRVSHRSN